jgi:hypothetical protein
MTIGCVPACSALRTVGFDLGGGAGDAFSAVADASFAGAAPLKIAMAALASGVAAAGFGGVAGAFEETVTGLAAANGRMQIKHSTVVPALTVPPKLSVDWQCGQVSCVPAITGSLGFVAARLNHAGMGSPNSARYNLAAT